MLLDIRRPTSFEVLKRVCEKLFGEEAKDMLIIDDWYAFPDKAALDMKRGGIYQMKHEKNFETFISFMAVGRVEPKISAPDVARILAQESGIDVAWDDENLLEWVENPIEPEDAECPMCARFLFRPSGEVIKLGFYDEP